MAKSYQAIHLGQPIDENAIGNVTSRTFPQWCEFSGLFIKQFPSGFISLSDLTLDGVYGEFLIKNKKIHPRVALNMKFDLAESNIFTRDFILKNNTQKGRGTAALLKHIELATDEQFDHINCFAYGGVVETEVRQEKQQKISNQFHGHVTWAKLGFTMIDKSHQKFIEKIRRDGRNENSLHELLLSSADGYNYWYSKGNEWYGEFDLSENSRNRNLLENYISGKFKYGQNNTL